MKINLSWQDPLNLAKIISQNYIQEDWIFLYSALHKQSKNSTSYIGLFPKKKIICEDFLAIQNQIKDNQEKWFGYLSYEVAQQFEKLSKTKKSLINLPKIYLINFSLLLKFNHKKKQLIVIFDDQKKLNEVLKYKEKKTSLLNNKIKKLSSNFSDQEYLHAIVDIKKMITCGDFYQTNLTRKFFGEFTKKQDVQQSFQTFLQLTDISPANFAAFLKLGENCIISSSPELFLSIKNKTIVSRPIKGTAPRDNDKKQDLKYKMMLKNSIKERAENLMIVDLVRNDLARFCKVGSVAVRKLFSIMSYKNIHHMSSEIYGKIDKKFSIFDAVRFSFPPGSMTGAPKIKAMEAAAKKEKINRGIYSGAIGFFNGQKEVSLSVVIRTLIISNKKFEFQAGGAITFDSKPEDELQEVFNKIKALCLVLKYNQSDH
jgi:para-aminobenzoate synthetase component 1